MMAPQTPRVVPTEHFLAVSGLGTTEVTWSEPWEHSDVLVPGLLQGGQPQHEWPEPPQSAKRKKRQASRSWTLPVSWWQTAL